MQKSVHDSLRHGKMRYFVKRDGVYICSLFQTPCSMASWVNYEDHWSTVIWNTTVSLMVEGLVDTKTILVNIWPVQGLRMQIHLIDLPTPWMLTQLMCLMR